MKKIGRLDLPHTSLDLKIQRAALEKQLKEINLAESALTEREFKQSVWFKAVIPANDPSQETVKAFGDDLETVVRQVCEEWNHKHPKTRASRSDVYAYLIAGNQSVAISPHDAPSSIRITRIEEDRSPRKRVVWSSDDRGCDWLK